MRSREAPNEVLAREASRMRAPQGRLGIRASQEASQLRASVRATAFRAWCRHCRPSQQSIGAQPEDHMRESKVRKTAAN